MKPENDEIIFVYSFPTRSLDNPEAFKKFRSKLGALEIIFDTLYLRAIGVWVTKSDNLINIPEFNDVGMPNTGVVLDIGYKYLLADTDEATMITKKRKKRACVLTKHELKPDVNSTVVITVKV